MSENFNKNFEEYQERDGNDGKLFLILFATIALPSIIVAYLEYFIFFVKLKWKIHISLIPIFILFLINFLYMKLAKPFSNIVWNNPKTYLSAYFGSTIFLGVILGYIFILWQARQLKLYPELRHLKGWAKDFEYAPTPFEILKKKRLINSLRNGEAYSKSEAPLGVLEAPVELRNEKQYNSSHIVARNYNEAFKSTLVTGGVGSGKTITMLNLMRNDIKAGYPICVVDFKKGPDMAYLLSKWAYEEKIPFYHFVSGRVGTYKNPYCSHQASYDPLASGNSTSKADMVLGMREWDSASDVYKGRTKSILQAIFHLLENVDKSKVPNIHWENGGIAQFVDALHLPNLHDLVQEYNNSKLGLQLSAGDKRKLDQINAFYTELTAERNSALKEQLDGLAVIFRTLILSNYSDWLAKGETPYHIDLFKIAMSNTPSVVLFQFNPNEEPDFAKYMGTIILQDLARVSGLKNAEGNITPFGLYIDEFQTLPPSSITGIIEKARSAKFFSTFSSQSLEQITQVQNGDKILRAILDTMSCFIVHKGSYEGSLEYFSEIIGKTQKKIYKTTGKRNSSIFSFNLKNSRNSMISESIEEKYMVDPAMLANLSSPEANNGFKGTGYYISKESEFKPLAGLSQVIARKFHAVVDKEVLEQVPEKFRKDLLTSGMYEEKKNKKKEISNKENIIQNIAKKDDIEKKNDILFDDTFDLDFTPNVEKKKHSFSKEQYDLENSINFDFLLEQDSEVDKQIIFENHSQKKTQEKVNILNQLDSNLLKQGNLTQKEFSKMSNREKFQKPRKQTSFEKFKKQK